MPHDCLCLFALLQVNNCARMQYKFYMNDPHWRGGDGNPGSPGIMLSRATNSLPGVHDDRMPSASSSHRRITTASPSHQPSSHRSLTPASFITASSPHHHRITQPLCQTCASMTLMAPVGRSSGLWKTTNQSSTTTRSRKTSPKL